MSASRRRATTPTEPCTRFMKNAAIAVLGRFGRRIWGSLLNRALEGIALIAPPPSANSSATTGSPAASPAAAPSSTSTSATSGSHTEAPTPMRSDVRQLALERLAATAIADMRTFSDRLPPTYLMAKQVYPFLPTRSVQLDLFWYEASPVGRAVFVLDYVGRLYRAVNVPPAVAAIRTERPLVVVRTFDHPEAGGR